MNRSLTRLRRVFLVFAICAAVLLVAREEWRRGQPRLVMLDVGQGDAIYIRTPSGQDFLIDAGRGSQVTEQLSREMPFSDRTIELAIATHFDSDHVGGFLDVLEHFSVSTFATNGATPDTDLGQELMAAVSDERAQTITLLAGTVLSDDTYHLEVLWPNDSSKPSNEGSIVARLQTATTSVLLTGDAELKTERALLASGESLEADVLKVGHHGSKTSSSEGFVKALGGTRALISVGATNRYGHPADDVIQRLQDVGYRIERTDQQGSITVPL